MRMKAMCMVVLGWFGCFWVSAADWNQWRGPDRTGSVGEGSSAWPKTLEGKLTKEWSVDLDASYSGPVVSGDLVYTTATRKASKEAVMAFNRHTGKKVWETTWDGAMKVPFFARKNGSWIRSTPIVDQGRLYVGGILDVVVCLDAKTGEEVWRVDFVERYEAKKPAFGMVCSPLVDGGFVYVQAGAGFCKLDAETGKSVWRTLVDGGGMYGSAFSSPILATIDGKRQAVVQTRTALCGVDIDDGTVLWKQAVEAFRGMNILTPVVSGNRVFTSAYGGRSHGFDVSRSGDDGAWRIQEAWNAKLQGYMCSPVLIDGSVFFHLRNERFASMALSDGEIAGVSKGSYGKYVSLVRQGGQILALNERGLLRLLAVADGQVRLVDSAPVSDGETWAHLAVQGNQLLIRELKGLVAYRWE